MTGAAQAGEFQLSFASSPLARYHSKWSTEVPVIIDGNNLLYAARAAEDERLLVGRAMLCDVLGRWAERRREAVCVVFDGATPEAALARQIAHPAIQILYSGAGKSADAVVVEMIKTSSAPRRLTVVSSDRVIAQAARRRRAVALSADAFWVMVRRDLARPVRRRTEPAEKEAGLDPDARRQWLREFGFEEQSSG